MFCIHCVLGGAFLIHKPRKLRLKVLKKLFLISLGCSNKTAGTVHFFWKSCSTCVNEKVCLKCVQINGERKIQDGGHLRSDFIFAASDFIFVTGKKNNPTFVWRCSSLKLFLILILFIVLFVELLEAFWFFCWNFSGWNFGS